MDFQKLIASLEHFGTMLPEVVGGVAQDDSRWEPADGAWSILEIVCHLADEEEFDFRERHLRQILKRMDQMAARGADGYSNRYAGEWSA